MTTSELTGPALDWAVAKCEFGHHEEWDGTLTGVDVVSDMEGSTFAPSTNWAQGGPIIELEAICICTQLTSHDWQAVDFHGDITQFGPTPLIAAMRCYVASKLGDEVEIPEKLL